MFPSQTAVFAADDEVPRPEPETAREERAAPTERLGRREDIQDAAALPSGRHRRQADTEALQRVDGGQQQAEAGQQWQCR